MKLLCLDFGNTRVKWGVHTARAWAAQGALPLAEMAAWLPPDAAGVAAIIACNVAGAAAAAAGERLAQRLAAPLTWIEASPAQCGVTNGYETPQQLGADRWAALIGARGLCREACLVVMCGTATTIDALTSEGVFCGGLILPGLDLMAQALAGNTAQLPLAHGQTEAKPWPRNTADAITSGAVAATLGAIEYLRKGSHARAPCILSGGAAQRLAAHLAPPPLRVDNLVLEGLARIAASH